MKIYYTGRTKQTLNQYLIWKPVVEILLSMMLSIWQGTILSHDHKPQQAITGEIERTDKNVCFLNHANVTTKKWNMLDEIQPCLQFDISRTGTHNCQRHLLSGLKHKMLWHGLTSGPRPGRIQRWRWVLNSKQKGIVEMEYFHILVCE